VGGGVTVGFHSMWAELGRGSGFVPSESAMRSRDMFVVVQARPALREERPPLCLLAG
jgi:hypothetical protein